MDATHIGSAIGRYHIKHIKNKREVPHPISFSKPSTFPDVGQLEIGNGTIEAVFEELRKRELRKAKRSLMKTLKNYGSYLYREKGRGDINPSG